jgi:hypothetical protein
MNPINTRSDEPVIFALVNGGAGLILIGTESSANAKKSATTAFARVDFLGKDTWIAQAAHGKGAGLSRQLSALTVVGLRLAKRRNS